LTCGLELALIPEKLTRNLTSHLADMGQVPKMLERPLSALAKPSSRLDHEQQQQMYGHLPFSPSKKQTSRPQQSRHKGQLKVSPKSICVDAEELRRRLNIVLQEQNSRKSRQQLQSISTGESPAQDRVRGSLAAPSEHPAVTLDTARPKCHESVKAQPSPRPADASVMAGRPQRKASNSGIREDKKKDTSPAKTIAHSESCAALNQDRQTPTKHKVRHSYSALPLQKSPTDAQYQHLPQNAAAQFSSTATTQSMQEKQLIHPLAREAFEKLEQARLAERASSESTGPTSRTWSLKQARSQQQQNAAYERNQFQEGSLMLKPGGSRRNTVHGAGSDTLADFGMDNIFEDEEFVAKQKRQAGRKAESAADYANIVNDRRIDWTQTDEVEKKRSGLLYVFRMKKLADEPASATSKNKLRLPKMPSKMDLSQSTGPLPVVGPKSPKSPLSFLSKFKRQQFVKV